jgi:hypothetical protein
MCAINNAKELLQIIRLGFYSIELNNGFIEISPAFSIDNQMTDLIKTHKADLIKLLESESANNA